MSIYATTFDIADYDHAFDCERLVPLAGYDNVWEQDPDKPCTCHAGPIAYRGSHILPSDDDPRGGCLDLGAIPGFIDAPGRVLCDEEQCPEPATVCCKRRWPYLRASVNSETVVLTRGHVADVHRELGEWLDSTKPADAPESEPAPDLSVREEQVLRGIAAGLTNAAIGRQLHIHPETVRSHLRRLLAKLGARNRANAVARGYDLGLLPGDSA